MTDRSIREQSRFVDSLRDRLDEPLDIATRHEIEAQLRDAEAVLRRMRKRTERDEPWPTGDNC